MSENLTKIIDYYLEQITHDTRPVEIALALCQERWPGKQFSCPHPDDPEMGLCYLRDVVDENGMTAHRLLELDEERKRATAALHGNPGAGSE